MLVTADPTLKRLHLPFLDGVRAIAALYIFVIHAVQVQFPLYADQWFSFPMLWGKEAVATFITLSGFCLGLQLVKRQNFWTYIGRRSTRLLPPYFAALAVLCCLYVWRVGAVPFGFLLPNLLLINELSGAASLLTGAAVFWSVGIEYRIYWLLPIMSTCFCRAGYWGLGLSAIALYLLSALILIALHLPDGSTWFIISFAMGVAASQALLIKLPNRVIALTLLVSCFPLKLQSLTTDFLLASRISSELLFSGVISVLLLAGARLLAKEKSNSYLALLSHPLLGWVAEWSYSLYLLHYGLLRYTKFLLDGYQIKDWDAIALQTIPVLLCCWLFSQVFERPFLRAKPIAVS